MTDPTPTRAEAVAHILGLRHMSGDDLHLPSAADFIERLAAGNDALRERAEAAERRASEAQSRFLGAAHQLTAARRAEAAAWNDAIEAAAVAAQPWDKDTEDGKMARVAAVNNIRALRRAAPTEGEA